LVTGRTDPSFFVLHALRLKGRARAAAIAVTTGLEESEVEAVLASLERDGLAAAKSGGWGLTAAGRNQHGRALHTAGRGDDAAAEAINEAYRRFLSLNDPFKSLCTDWQLRDGRPGTPNDHTDTTYDRHVIDRLGELHQEAVQIVDDLARVAPRYDCYRRRFDAAHARLLAGDLSALTMPLAESYHDVWMELHEDLLMTLGIERRGTDA
jgi:hypothetical protein